MGDEDDFMSGSAKTFPFETVGDEVTGQILSVKKRQQTSMDTGELAYWPDGQPKMMFTFELATRIREDEDDDGVRTINVRWKSEEAIKAAVRQSGARKPEVGGTLTLKFTGEVPPKTKGFSKTKLWAARYVPPDTSADFMDQPTGQPLRPEVQQQNFAQGGIVEARSGTRQARNVDHHGQPQDPNVPDWGQPQASTPHRSATPEERAISARLVAGQRAGSARLGMTREGPPVKDERQHFGY